MPISIERTSYFHPEKGPHLAWKESSPPHKHSEKHLCNCTKQVTERPEGTPDQVVQHVLILGDQGQFKTEVDLTTLHFTFRWDESLDVDCRKHAYFWFSTKENRLQIEVTVPKYGRVDCFFGHLYLGRNINVSQLYNGHSPSEVIDFREFKEDQLWAHHCDWGCESVLFFDDASPETVKWKSLFRRIEVLRERTQKYREDLTSPVKLIHSALEEDSATLSHVASIRSDLVATINNLTATQLFSVCAAANAQAEYLQRQRMRQQRAREAAERGAN
jgi:hypothetical protein